LSDADKLNSKRVVFAEADNYKTLRAAQIVKEDGIAIPILLGNKKKIQQLIDDNLLELADVPIIDPVEEKGNERFTKYVDFLYAKRQRRGVSYLDAQKLMLDRNYFGADRKSVVWE